MSLIFWFKSIQDGRPDPGESDVGYSKNQNQKWWMQEGEINTDFGY